MNRFSYPRPFLIIQIRPEDEAADDELAAMIRFGGLTSRRIVRWQADRQPMPPGSATDFCGVIVGGGPANISDNPKKPANVKMEAAIKKLLADIVTLDIPYLGACYGLGLLASYLGGEVLQGRYAEPVGAVTVYRQAAARDDPLLRGFPAKFKVFGGHKEACQALPTGCRLLLSSRSCPIQMIRFKNNIYATQFHAELDTPGIALRIKVYRHAGYFRADEMDELLKKVGRHRVVWPVKLLRRFVEIYG